MKKHVYVLRTCNDDGTSFNGFKWPKKGKVSCPDWKPTEECGNDFHGALKGEGDGQLFNWSPDALWQVIKVNASDIIDLGGKVKFPCGEVVYTGNRQDATNLIEKYHPEARAIIGITLTGGDNSTLTGGDESTLIGGDESTLTGGYGATLVGGDNSTLTGGDESTLTGGDWSTLTGGDYSTLTGGYRSTLIGGDWSTLIGGDLSALVFKYWDGQHRIKIGYIGEDGLKSNTPYTLDGNFNIMEKKK